MCPASTRPSLCDERTRTRNTQKNSQTQTSTVENRIQHALDNFETTKRNAPATSHLVKQGSFKISLESWVKTISTINETSLTAKQIKNNTTRIVGSQTARHNMRLANCFHKMLSQSAFTNCVHKLYHTNVRERGTGITTEPTRGGIRRHTHLFYSAQGYN